MKRVMVGLVILIPALSVALGIGMWYLASQSTDQEVHVEQVPLSKTSWRTDS